MAQEFDGDAGLQSFERQEGAGARPSRIDLRLGLDQTDNVAQTTDDRIDAASLLAGVSADWTRDGRKLDLSLLADINWVKFLNDNYATRANDGAFVTFLADWGEPQDWFQWRLADTFTQARLNPFANSTPDNLEYINTLSTGPTLLFSLGERTFLEVLGDLTTSTFEESALDTEQLSGGFGLGRGIGPRSSLALRARTARTEYEDGVPFSSFDTQEYFLRYEFSGGRTTLTGDVGYTSLSDAGLRETSPLVRIDLNRTIGQRSVAYLRAEQAYVAAAQLALSQIANPAIGGFGAPISVGGGVATRGAFLGWSRTMPRTSFSVELGLRDERYLQARDFDRTVYVAQGVFSRRLRSTLSLTASGEYRVEELESGLAPDATFVSFGVGAALRLGTRTSLSLDLRRQDRSGGGFFDFTENLVALRLSYSLSGDPAMGDGGE